MRQLNDISGTERCRVLDLSFFGDLSFIYPAPLLPWLGMLAYISLHGYSMTIAVCGKVSFYVPSPQCLSGRSKADALRPGIVAM